MVTDRDLCMAAYHGGKSLKELDVGRAMSRDVVVCSPEDDLTKAQNLMRENQVRRLPVVDRKGTLKGILSLAHIARAARNGRGAGINKEEVCETLASICEPTANQGRQ